MKLYIGWNATSDHILRIDLPLWDFCTAGTLLERESRLIPGPCGAITWIPCTCSNAALARSMQGAFGKAQRGNSYRQTGVAMFIHVDDRTINMHWRCSDFAWLQR